MVDTEAVSRAQLFEAIQRASTQTETHLDLLGKEVRGIADRLLAQEIYQKQMQENQKALDTEVSMLEDQRIKPLEAAQLTQAGQIKEIQDNQKNRWAFANAVVPVIISTAVPLIILWLTGQIATP